MAATVADPSGTSEGIVNSPSDNPSLSYIALIAKVILSAPSQKLNLVSIYRAMEEQFPHLRSRGPGWRNSVRHNLSVNECFVKVSRCEDGRGHYWGVHHDNLTDFQQGDFSRCRRPRGRRRRSDSATGRLARTDIDCFLCRFYESRALADVEPRCPLQDPRRYQLTSLDWAKQVYQPWGVTVAGVHPPSWGKPYSSPDTYCRVTAERGHVGDLMTSWETTDPEVTGMKESHDIRLMTLTAQACMFPVCWCLSAASKDLKQSLYYF